MIRTLTRPDVPPLKNNIKVLCEQGYVECLDEHRVTQAVQEPDPMNPGETHAICVFCGSRRLQVHPPAY